jgi:multidrug efflux pump subunit AcrB
MLKFLLHRPIAVFMTMTALLALSVLAFFRLPVSLLPDTDVPYITLSVRVPNSPPEQIEQNVLRPMRERMLSVNGLKSLESTAQSETGSLTLRFEYGTDMKLAYIEVNEKVDRLTPVFPSGMERPLVIKSATSDIPVLRIQVVPLNESEMVNTSDVALFTLKRRLEQLEGVGLVDLNGLQRQVIRIESDPALLASLDLSEADIQQTIQQANLSIGALTVRDGNYRYYLKLSTNPGNPEVLGNLSVLLPNQRVVALKKIAQVQYDTETPAGYHLFNQHTGLVINVHKQAEAKMPEVMPRLYEAVEQFKTDFPELQFYITQDQSALLDISIQNLSQAVLWGGAFAFAVLFIFMSSWREPVMMGIVIPVSLILSLSVLYTFQLSLNIISLSGLALGLGMLVDNSIVVVDSISLKRKEGLPLTEACVSGTTEVMVPLISSALTNLAVFLPLIFMSGITGALFYNQALSVAAILSTSLCCTFILIPLLYRLLYANPVLQAKEDSRLFFILKEAYHRSFSWVWRHRRPSLITMSLLIPIAIVLLIYLPKTGFPEIQRTETVIQLDWNEPISLEENRERIRDLIRQLQPRLAYAEADLGYQQFMLNPGVQSPRQAVLYLNYPTPKIRLTTDNWIQDFFRTRYPSCRITLKEAPNAFEQLFASRQPYFEARFRDPKTHVVLPDSLAEQLIEKLDQQETTPGRGLDFETAALLQINFNRLSALSVSYPDLLTQLEIAFGQYRITDIKELGLVVPVIWVAGSTHAGEVLQKTFVHSKDGTRYPLKEFITIRYGRQYQSITADAAGIYQSVSVSNLPNMSATQNFFRKLAEEFGLTVDFTGQWFENRDNLNQLFLILLVSLALMYFILTAEFESFSQPLLVLASLPLGFAGSLILLWVSGGTLNIMSGIGLVVVLGILDNDAILKIDRINTLRRHLPLDQAIQQAGLDRLKPIVMNTCTNVLAITPIIFSSGLGADLQRPVAITTIGGLIVATFTALYFVPLLYAALSKKNHSS